MKVTCERDQLLGFARLASMLRGQGKAKFPVLDCIHFSVGKLGFSARMTDLETQITQSLVGEGAEDGEMLLPLRWLLNALPFCEKLITLESDGANSKVQSGLASFSLVVPPASDYPAADDFFDKDCDPSTESSAVIEAPDFYNALRQTLPSVSYDESRYFLCGVYLDILKTGMNLVATDGRRLAVAGLDFTWRLVAGESAILPTKAAKLMRHLAQKAGVVDLSIAPGQVRASFCGTAVKTKPIEGEYVNYEHLIPREFPRGFVTDRLGLYQAVNRMNTVADAKSNRLRFRLEKGAPKIVSHSETGSASEPLQGDYEGEPLDIGINGNYIVAAMKAFKAKTVTIRLLESLRPWLIESAEENLRYLIMPMRIDDY